MSGRQHVIGALFRSLAMKNRRSFAKNRTRYAPLDVGGFLVGSLDTEDCYRDDGSIAGKLTKGVGVDSGMLLIFVRNDVN